MKLQATRKDANIDHGGIDLHNNVIYTNTRMVTNENVWLHPQAISSRGISWDIADSIQDCCGIVPRLNEGGMPQQFHCLN